MINKPTLNWVEIFRQNKNWNTIRFKKLNKNYPPFDFPEQLIDEVGMEQFLLEENNRIPLFLGIQFGVHPNPEEIFKDMKEPFLVAKLDKSLLSGHVSGLSICNYKNGRFHEIEFIKN